MLPMPCATDALRRWGGLAASVLVVAGIWLLVLPVIGAQPRVQTMIENNERLGIDPSAKFYTELPGMERFLQRIDDTHRQHPNVMWSRSAPEHASISQPAPHVPL
jgi:hypothetical protein